jgi:hypothetical protein
LLHVAWFIEEYQDSAATAPGCRGGRLSFALSSPT